MKQQRRHYKEFTSRHPLYNTWKKMIHRCHHPYHHKFAAYGGRGVEVAQAWRDSFPTFVSDVGPRPSPIHTLDRYPDFEGHYEPGNVRWATPKEQGNNRRDNTRTELAEASRLRSEWCAIFDMRKRTVTERLTRGWGIEAALYLRPRRGIEEEALRIVSLYALQPPAPEPRPQPPAPLPRVPPADLPDGPSQYGVTLNGVTRTKREWAAHLGISLNTLEGRLERGWSRERAFTTPNTNARPRAS